MGITYDTREYNIEIYVGSNNKDEIKLIIKVNNQEVDIIDILFENTCYRVPNAPETGVGDNLVSIIEIMFFTSTLLAMLYLYEENKKLLSK